MENFLALINSRHRVPPLVEYYLNFDAVSQDRIVIPEVWGTVSGFKVSYDIREFNTGAGTSVLMKHGNDFRPDPSFRLAIIAGVVQVLIRNTGGTIETISSVMLTLPYTGVIKVEGNSLWVDADEYPITYTMDSTWNDEVDTFVGINNNLTGGFTGEIDSFITPIETYLCNEGSGFPVTGSLGGTGTGATANAGGSVYWDGTVWQPYP